MQEYKKNTEKCNHTFQGHIVLVEIVTFSNREILLPLTVASKMRGAPSPKMSLSSELNCTKTKHTHTKINNVVETADFLVLSLCCTETVNSLTNPVAF